jgi:hypothetical protein
MTKNNKRITAIKLGGSPFSHHLRKRHLTTNG